jgi:hypothetical protein
MSLQAFLSRGCSFSFYKVTLQGALFYSASTGLNIFTNEGGTEQQITRLDKNHLPFK